MEPIVSLVTLSRLLSALAELVIEMKDATQACKRVYERLRDILEELRALVELPAGSKLAKYAQLLQRYLDFLESYRAKPLVWRLVKNTAMMDELKAFHEEIDTVVVLLQLSTTRLLVDWRQQWRDDAEVQMQLLLLLVDNNANVLKEVQDTRKQVEALMSLKFELEQRHADQTDQMTAIMKKLYNQIVRVSNVQVPSLPPWFIPSSDVEYYPAPFAQGSFGAVHHARWNSGARVVVKTLLVDNLANQTTTSSAQSRILSEIGVWFQLNHPNVIKMYGACHVSMPPFIVCELAPHGNMADFLDRSPDHQQLMWQLLYEAALGLEYLHKRKVVHGDLKLNNILVGADGTARLADFGLSSVRSTTATSATSSRTQRSSDSGLAYPSAGALRWRAPECLRRRPRFASDTYSLGMCIIEAATGEPPYAYADDGLVLQLLLNGTPPGQPDELEDDEWALVEAMTKPQPSERCSLEFAISALKKLARRTVIASSKPDFFRTPRYSMSSNGSTMSLSSMSAMSEDMSLHVPSLVMHQPEGAHSSEAFPPVDSPRDTYPESQPTRHLDEMEIDGDTSIVRIVELISIWPPTHRKRALQCLYRRASEAYVCTKVSELDGVRILSEVCQDASTGLYEQLYAFGCLRLFANPQMFNVVGMARALRDLTASDRSQLRDALSVAHTDDERLEAAEAIAIVVYAMPRSHGLDECAVPLVDILSDSAESLFIAATHSLVAFFADSPSTTMVRLLQLRALPALVQLLGTTTIRKQEAIVSAIDTIVTRSSSAGHPALAAVVIAPLITLAQSTRGHLRLLSVRTLSHIAQAGSDPTKALMVEAGVVVLLTELVERGRGMERATAALTLGHLALDSAERQVVVADSGVIAALVELIRSGGHADKSAASIAVAYLAKGNEANAISMGVAGAMEVLVGIVTASASQDHEQYVALLALSYLAKPRVNAVRLSTLDVKDALAVIAASARDNKQAELAAQILEGLATRDGTIDKPDGDKASSPLDGDGDESKPSSPLGTIAGSEYYGTVDARTMIDDLLRVVSVRGTTTSDDRVKTALRWLYRHAYDKALGITIRENDGLAVLSEIAKDTSAAYNHRLYACGCLWQLCLDGDTSGAHVDLGEPDYAELQRLYEAMSPQNIDERRAEAVELLTCLQCAHTEDHGVADFLPRIRDALRSPTSARLIGAAARAVAVFARRLPVSAQLMIDHGVLPLLVDQVVEGDAFTADTAAEALGALAATGSAPQTHVIDAGAMAPLIRLIRHGTAQQKRLAVGALGELLRENGSAQREAAQAGAVGPLMDLLKSHDDDLVALGANGIRSLSSSGESGATAVVLLGAVPLLHGLVLREPLAISARREVARALEVLSCRSSATSTLVKLGVGDAMYRFSTAAEDAQLKCVALRAAQNLA